MALIVNLGWYNPSVISPEFECFSNSYTKLRRFERPTTHVNPFTTNPRLTVSPITPHYLYSQHVWLTKEQAVLLQRQAGCTSDGIHGSRNRIQRLVVPPLSIQSTAGVHTFYPPCQYRLFFPCSVFWIASCVTGSLISRDYYTAPLYPAFYLGL